MKKLISTALFALVAVSGMALVPTRAEAIPAFARQTGAACLSCHFQTFPALTPFGRAFKMGSFTDVGDQALIEDDNLSIPAVLNASMVVRANVSHVTGSGGPSTTVYNIPTDDNFLVAGRVGSNTGAFVEFAGGANNIQLLNSWDVGGFKLGVGWANTSFGGSSVMEVSNVFGQHSTKLGGDNMSAINAAGFASNSGNAIGGGGTNTSSIAAWIGNDLGYIQLAFLMPADATGGATDIGSRTGHLVRGAVTLDVAGWDAVAGFGTVSGNAGTGSAGGLRVPMKLLFFDAQMQGEVGGMSVGIYLDGSRARGRTGGAGRGNFYGSDFVPNQVTGTAGSFALTPFSNVSGTKFSAVGGRIEVQPMSRLLVGIGYRWEDFSGLSAGQITRKTFQVAATYQLYQNLNINVVFDNAKVDDPSASIAGASVNALTGTFTPGRASFTKRTTVIDIEALM